MASYVFVCSVLMFAHSRSQMEPVLINGKKPKDWRGIMVAFVWQK